MIDEFKKSVLEYISNNGIVYSSVAIEKELGIETVQRSIDRSELYTASECFLTGTAAHITPVAAIDHRQIGNGEIGEITKKLQQLYSDVLRGNNPKYFDWCTAVYKR